MTPLDIVLGYHQVTKHQPGRYARSTGYLDWATQPNPFRRYRGAPLVPLLLGEPADSPSYDALYEPGAVTPQPVCLETVSAFFQYSLALSAWKEYGGTRWALRVNPSSGNLHPTEGYLGIGTVDGIAEVPGIFHYAPQEHLLERRCEVQPDVWDELIGGFPGGTFLAGLSSVHWREAWKYGERAYRYCQHDVGHALGALCLAAALHGWRVWPLVGMSDAAVGTLLGVDRTADFAGAESEQADAIVAVIPSADAPADDWPLALSDDAIAALERGPWFGRANALSSDHVEWEIIDSVADACAKPSITERPITTPASESADPLAPRRPANAARQIILQRRSAVAMDGRTGLTSDQFFLMMDRVGPRFERPPWTALGPPARVHLGLFVHRVAGLTSGLYFLVRATDRLSQLRESMRPEFEWSRPPGCPASVPLYHLTPGDARAVAGQVSCGQAIAADGAFSLGMIAEFVEPLRNHGAWFYRRLFWETGLIGQVLYLEAEAAGVRSTGIGCFFDDLVHDLFGLENDRYQSLYHFTVGTPVEDTRLMTRPPYPLDGDRRS